jgi:hypothetical protein
MNREVKLTTDIHLVPRLRMRRAITLLSLICLDGIGKALATFIPLLNVGI